MDFETRRPLSRENIRDISNNIRNILKIKTIKFPVLKSLEMLCDKFPNNLYYRVLDDNYFESKVMSALVPETKNNYCINIRQSVYDNAVNGDGASLGFICHEICHFILIHLYDAGPLFIYGENNKIYARIFNKQKMPSYKSMEWQAKALCGEIMIPYDKCKNYSFEQIVRRTNSSYQQSRYFLDFIVNNIKQPFP